MPLKTNQRKHKKKLLQNDSRIEDSIIIRYKKNKYIKPYKNKTIKYKLIFFILLLLYLYFNLIELKMDPMNLMPVPSRVLKKIEENV